MRGFNVLVALALMPSLAHAAPSDDELRGDPRGAVLCIWTIYVDLKTIGRVCGFDQESEFEKVLAESIDRMDKFITANSTITQGELQRKKDQELSSMREQMEKVGPALSQAGCQGKIKSAGIEMYRVFEVQGAEKIRQDISELLAVPRKPVFNPCL
jgi:hypothetical protein